jgi:hypothetical protein
MKKFSLLSICLVFLLVAGCGPQPQKEAAQMQFIPGAVVSEDGAITFSASGKAAIADVDDPLARIKAEAAAAATAKSNLLELIKGAKISTNTVIADLMYESSKTEMEVMGWLSRAKVTITETSGRLVPGAIVEAIATLTLDQETFARLVPEELTFTE